MPDQKLKLNILNFEHPQEKIEVSLFREKAEGLSPIAKYEVPLEIYDSNPELKDEEFEYLYSDFTNHENADYSVTVDLNNSFGRDQSGIRPFDGIKQFGPNHPSPLSHVRMFFICHEDDAPDSANLLYSHLQNGFKSFRGLKRFVRLPISIKKDEQITFTDKDDPLTEIRQHLTQKTLDPQVSYLAMYIHPRSKEEQTEADRRAFYQVKEELLKFGITSQGVVKNTISDPEAQFSLSNIAVALLAKLDGIPWRLERSTYSELIVGVGAFKPRSAQYRYVGSAFCFSNDGRFQGFECYSENSTKMLAGSIRKAVRTYSSVHPDVKRLVIHFYKNMSNDELKPILKALHDLGLENIPVIVITINKTTSKDMVVFDSKSKDLMQVSGTFINVGRNQFLLCNNTRYSANTAKIDSFPFPVKISIQADKAVLNDQKTVRNLIDQVYQYSRMYWKSTKQQNLPVTIKYPEMVAEAFPYFKSNRIPEFGENNLWFL